MREAFFSMKQRSSPHFGKGGSLARGWTYSILNNMHFDNSEEGRVSMRFSSQHLIWGVSYGF